jgi:hypothetical protein
VKIVPCEVITNHEIPQTPRTSALTTLPSFSTTFSNLFTLLTRRPTDNGPRIVHKTIAHVTIKKIGDEPDSALVVPGENIPLLSAMEDIRKPISPRATMALPKIDAGYREIGFRGLGVV